MYQAEKFAVQDQAALFSVIEKFPFATVTTVAEGKPFVNHLPITFQADEGKFSLFGHMSKHNPQWHHMRAGSPVVIAFQGPHCYVNPNWYVDGDVPTWNYVVVHAEGAAEVVEDAAGIVKILQKTTDHMNRLHAEKWDFYLPDDLRGEQLAQAIVGFRITAPLLLGKFKLNQNRTAADRAGVIAGLKGRTDDGSRGIAEWMKRG